MVKRNQEVLERQSKMKKAMLNQRRKWKNAQANKMLDEKCKVRFVEKKRVFIINKSLYFYFLKQKSESIKKQREHLHLKRFDSNAFIIL